MPGSYIDAWIDCYILTGSVVRVFTSNSYQTQSGFRKMNVQVIAITQDYPVSVTMPIVINSETSPNFLVGIPTYSHLILGILDFIKFNVVIAFTLDDTFQQIISPPPTSTTKTWYKYVIVID